MFTDFTLEVLPDIRVHDCGLFTVTFTSEPLLEAAEANVLHRALALAWDNHDVVRELLLRQANPAAEILGGVHFVL